jgi:hypothetical protein
MSSISSSQATNKSPPLVTNPSTPALRSQNSAQHTTACPPHQQYVCQNLWTPTEYLATEGSYFVNPRPILRHNLRCDNCAQLSWATDGCTVSSPADLVGGSIRKIQMVIRAAGKGEMLQKRQIRKVPSGGEWKETKYDDDLTRLHLNVLKMLAHLGKELRSRLPLLCFEVLTS